MDQPVGLHHYVNRLDAPHRMSTVLVALPRAQFQECMGPEPTGGETQDVGAWARAHILACSAHVHIECSVTDAGTPDQAGRPEAGVINGWQI